MHKSHTDQLRAELLESYLHARRAAALAPGAGAEQVTPAYDKARGVASKGWQSTKGTITPLYATMKDGARNARMIAEFKVKPESKSYKWPALIGLLAAGVAVGAAGAMVARRRKAAQQWDEFEPAAALDDAESSIAGVAGMAKGATKKVTTGAANLAGTVSDKTGKLADSLHEKAGSTPSGKVGEAMSAGAEKAGDLAEKASEKAGELADKASEKGSSFSAFADETADDVIARASAASRNGRQ
jgi:hypothetical protein